ncbi:MAG: carboxymuconolactone decarboxylase family protein [Nitrospinota bacterium]
MAMSPMGQQLYDEMREARGFVYPAFALLCETAPEMLEKYEDLKNHLMNSDGPFPEKYRELFIIVAIAMRDPTYTDGIKNHIKRAMKLGATVPEIVQAVFCTLAPCGMMAPIKVFTLFKEVIDEEGD